VEGRGRHHEVEGEGLYFPVLERDVEQLDVGVPLQLSARYGQKLPAYIYAEHPVASTGEWEGGLTRPTAHLQDPSARRDARDPDYVLYQFLRVPGTGLVIVHGRRIEAFPRPHIPLLQFVTAHDNLAGSIRYQKRNRAWFDIQVERHLPTKRCVFPMIVMGL